MKRGDICETGWYHGYFIIACKSHLASRDAALTEVLGSHAPIREEARPPSSLSPPSPSLCLSQDSRGGKRGHNMIPESPAPLEEEEEEDTMLGRRYISSS